MSPSYPRPLRTGPRLILNQPFFVSSLNAQLSISTHQLEELEVLLGKSNGSQGMGGEKPHLPVIVDMPKVLNFFAESPCNAERAEIFTNLTETPAMQANQSEAHLTAKLLVNPTVLSGWKSSFAPLKKSRRLGKTLFLCVNRASIRYGFRACAKAIPYSVNITSMK